MATGLAPEGKFDREATAAELRRYVETIVKLARFELRFEVELLKPRASEAEDAPEIAVRLDGRDSDLLLAHGAELLKALEHVGVRWLRLDRAWHDRVRFDCGTYHEDRLAELKLSAQVAAQRVRETGQPFRFNAMEPRERRVIHMTLQQQAGVRSESEGAGEQRRVVVLPTDKKK
jgi:spoIIIJ-associated protein